MVSFIVGGIVTLVTFYIALIYASESIVLLGFAEAVLLVLAFLFLVWRKRCISAEIDSPLTKQGMRFRLCFACITAESLCVRESVTG